MGIYITSKLAIVVPKTPKPHPQNRTQPMQWSDFGDFPSVWSHHSWKNFSLKPTKKKRSFPLSNHHLRYSILISYIFKGKTFENTIYRWFPGLFWRCFPQFPVAAFSSKDTKAWRRGTGCVNSMGLTGCGPLQIATLP